jgi:hypothetical protein
MREKQTRKVQRVTLPGVDGKLSWVDEGIFKRGFCSDLVGELAYIGRPPPLFSQMLPFAPCFTTQQWTSRWSSSLLLYQSLQNRESTEHLIFQT